MAVIEVEQLTKRYEVDQKEAGLGDALRQLVRPRKRTVRAVTDLSFSVEEGEFIGFLGPNGAGKTTTLKMLSGILYPTSGNARVLGYVPWKREYAFLRQIAIVMGQKTQLVLDLPSVDYFYLLKEIYDIPTNVFNERLKLLSKLLNVEHLLKTSGRQLSLGERMKFDLIAALLHGPKILFLDEPTIGLDVVSQQHVWDFLQKLNQLERVTIILTSHYMEDIQRLCKRVVIIDEGTKQFDGTLQELIDRLDDRREINVSFTQPIERKIIAKFGKIIAYQTQNATLLINKGALKNKIARLMTNLPVEDLRINPPDAREVIRTLFEKQRKKYIRVQ